MNKFLMNIFNNFIMILLSLIVIGFIITFVLFCCGNADFVFGFIIGVIILKIILILKNNV